MINTNATTIASVGEIEFWFEFGSTYSYLSVMRIEEAAAAHNVKVIWKPFLLGPIFKSLGWDTSPFLLQKAKGDYMWKDMERQCRKADVPWTRPTEFPRSSVCAMRIAVAFPNQAWIGEFCKRVMLLNFASDRDINQPEFIYDILEQLQLPVQNIVAESLSATNKPRLREQTEKAMARGIFGAPTFFVKDEMFWGNDRLDEALAFAAQDGTTGHASTSNMNNDKV